MLLKIYENTPGIDAKSLKIDFSRPKTAKNKFLSIDGKVFMLI